MDRRAFLEASLAAVAATGRPGAAQEPGGPSTGGASSSFDPWVEVRAANMRQNAPAARAGDVAASWGASVYDLTMQLNPLPPRRVLA